MQRTVTGLLATLLVVFAAAGWACGDNGGPARRAESDAAGGASRTGATLRIGSASAAVDEEGSVEIQALGLSEPGLGAWTMEIAYDPEVISIADCTVPKDGLFFCNAEASERALRLAGATAEGLLGDLTLATIAFRCDAAGTTELAMTVEVLADGTIGAPRDISETVEDGTITCQ